MPPQQPPYNPNPQQPQPASQYDFIMQPQAPKRAGFAPGSPKGMLFVVGAVALVLVLVVVIFSMLSGGGQDTKPFVTVEQQQQELVRVADLQYQNLRQERTKDFAINTKLTMSSDQAQLTALLQKHGVKMSSKEVALGANSATDTKLTQAVATSNLDNAVTTELQQELTAYRGSLRQAYASTTSTSTRALLKQLDTHAELLIAQSQQ